MKKIIIVGHDQENNEKLETLFQHFGMKKALPSRREGLTPIQVGELLSKAIKSQAPQIQEIDEEELPKKLPTPISKRRLKKNLKKQQNTPAASALPKSMWDYIPMDLMIANIDSEFWGWADKNALENLEYWKNLDPSIYFVLTYDHPQSLLLKLESENEEISKEIILEKLDDWNTYNTKILDFFEKSPERAILINNERIRQQNNSSLKALYSQVVPNEFNRQEIVSFEELSMDQAVSESPISSVLVNTIINNSPEISETFSRLNQQANFPSVEYYNSDIDSVIEAWRENFYKNKKLEMKIKENEVKSMEIRRKSNELEMIKLDNNKKEEEISHTVKYNNTLLEQIYTIQNKYEEIYLENKNTQKKIEEIEREKGDVLIENNRKSELLSSYEGNIQLLQQGKDLLENKIETIENENKLLLSQLLFVQEELERIFKEKDSPRKDDKLLFGAADRIRKQLDYRIGSTLIRNSSSFLGWISIPYSLFLTYYDYKKNSSKELANLPPVEQYQDASEAEKLKKHLSYKLGVTFIQNIKNPFKWLILPFALWKEILEFRRNKKQK